MFKVYAACGELDIAVTNLFGDSACVRACGGPCVRLSVRIQNVRQNQLLFSPRIPLCVTNFCSNKDCTWLMHKTFLLSVKYYFRFNHYLHLAQKLLSGHSTFMSFLYLFRFSRLMISHWIIEMIGHSRFSNTAIAHNECKTSFMAYTVLRN